MSLAEALRQILEETPELSPPSPEQEQTLVQHGELLLRWNRVHNLTRVRAPADVARTHFLDSLLGLQVLRVHMGAPPSGHLLDVGSGGGFPGLVAAVLWPSLHVTLVEAVQKKASFLRHAARELGLKNVSVESQRLEDLTCTANLVTTRATFPWEQLDCIVGSMTPGGSLGAWTGHEPSAAQWLGFASRVGLMEPRVLPYGGGALTERSIAFARLEALGR
jgi:16S rRNA (guanine527-N7)-methyltransferase